MGPNFWGEPILQKIWSICPPPLLYSNFKSFKDWISLSLVRFQGILLDSRIAFTDFWKFLQIEKGDLISGGEPILQKVCIIWSPFQYFTFKSFMNPNSSSFVRAQKKVFSDFWNFYKLKRGHLISRGSNSEESLIYLVPRSVFQFQFSKIEILCCSLDFNAFCMIQEYLSQILEISTN